MDHLSEKAVVSDKLPSTQDQEIQEPGVVIGSLLRALVTNLGLALDDVSASVEELGDAFMSMSSHDRELSGESAAQFEHCRHRAVRALQFHDRLDQRVRHVCLSLEEVASLACGEGGSDDVEHWHCLARSLRNACAVELDKRVFENVTHTDGSDLNALSGESTDHDARMELF